MGIDSIIDSDVLLPIPRFSHNSTHPTQGNIQHTGDVCFSNQQKNFGAMDRRGRRFIGTSLRSASRGEISDDVSSTIVVVGSMVAPKNEHVESI